MIGLNGSPTPQDEFVRVVEQKREAMPSALRIRAYNCWFGEMIDGDWQGNSYGTQTVELLPQ